MLESTSVETRLRFIFSSEFVGNGVGTHVNSMEKIPSHGGFFCFCLIFLLSTTFVRFSLLNIVQQSTLRKKLHQANKSK